VCPKTRFLKLSFRHMRGKTLLSGQSLVLFFSAFALCENVDHVDAAEARAVPMRPVTAVYHHVRRMYHPLGMQGKWTPTEDKSLLEYVGMALRCSASVLTIAQRCTRAWSAMGESKCPCWPGGAGLQGPVA
jgi:hypothetical protein